MSVSVIFSGPALSFLIYENTNSICDQEGFLVGEIIKHVKNTISDDEISNEQTETLISVNCLVPLPPNTTFYNNIGKVNKQKIKSFIGGMEEEIVGWYTFRRNAALNPHLRDKLLHKQLQTMIPNLSPEFFLMGLLNAVVSNTGSTYTFNHKFVRYRNRTYEALPVQVLNLGESRSEYTTVPMTSGLSESFGRIIRTVEISDKEGDVLAKCCIQQSLQEHLKKITTTLKESENRASQLEMEVESLRLNNNITANELLLPQPVQDDECKNNQLVSPEASRTEILVKPDIIDVSNSEEIKSQQKENNMGQSVSEDTVSYVSEMKLEVTPQKTSTISMGRRATSERGRTTRANTPRSSTQKRTIQTKIDSSDQRDFIPVTNQSTQTPSQADSPSVHSNSLSKNTINKQLSYATVARKGADNNATISKSSTPSANGASSEDNLGH